VVARGGETITISKCNLKSLDKACNARQTEQFHLLGNTWYVPLITNYDLAGMVIVKNNLFLGQERQKALSGQPMISSDPPTVSDYNAFYFAPAHTAPCVGYGIPCADAPDGDDLSQVRDQLGLEYHSFEPDYCAVDLAAMPSDYMCPTALYPLKTLIAEGRLIPTLEMFAPPSDSPLNYAGEGGAPIGAYPTTGG
jgi:hypothetical protein